MLRHRHLVRIQFDDQLLGGGDAIGKVTEVDPLAMLCRRCAAGTPDPIREFIDTSPQPTSESVADLKPKALMVKPVRIQGRMVAAIWSDEEPGQVFGILVLTTGSGVGIACDGASSSTEM